MLSSSAAGSSTFSGSAVMLPARGAANGFDTFGQLGAVGERYFDDGNPCGVQFIQCLIGD